MLSREELSWEYDDKLDRLEEFLAVEEQVSKEIDSIINKMEIEESLATESYTGDFLQLSTEELTGLSVKYFGDSEVGTIISNEDLTGERVNLITRFIKRLKDIYTRIFDIFNEVSALAGLFSDVNVVPLRDLREQILNKDRKMISDKRIDAGSVTAINKKLGIYYEMNTSKLEVKSLIDHFDMPYQLIVKEKLFNELGSYIYDQLIVGRFSLIGEDAEAPIPINKTAVKYLKSFKSPQIKKWLHKDTKAGIVDRTIGSRFSIVSVYQDYKGADARHDFFTINGQDMNNDIPVWSEKELISLLDYGIETADKFQAISNIATDGVWEQTWNELRSSFMTQIYQAGFGIFSIKRTWRYYYMASEFYSGLMKAMLMQNRSYKDTPELIGTITRRMTERR